MAWNYIPPSEGTDWPKVSGAWTELYAAYNERRLVLNHSSADAPTVGSASPAYAYWIGNIQSWIESNCTSFVATIDSGGSPITDYDGQNEIEMWTWDNIKSRVLGGRSWYRKKDSGTSEGNAAEGYYAPWIQTMIDLKNVLNELIWTKKLISWEEYNYNDDPTLHSYGGAESTNNSYTWAAAKSVAESTWGQEGIGALPKKYSTGSYHSSGYYRSNLFNCIGYVYVTGIPTGISKTVDIYPFSEKFSDSSEDYLYGNCPYGYAENTYNKIVSESLTSAATETTKHLVGDGDGSTMPTWCSEPTADNSRQGLGWAFSSVGYAIMKWDLTYK